MWEEFKAFIMRGSVVDMAVGIIIGAAFTAIVDSLVNDIIMPPIGYIFGGLDFTNLFITLGPESYDTLAQAQEAGAATINYGLFLNNLLTFLIVGFVVFMLIKAVNRLHTKEKEEEPTTKECPECLLTIPLEARRCPFCTTVLEAGAEA